MADLREKVGLLTSLHGGFGLGIAEGLAEAGATLYLATDASPEVQQTAVEAVESLGGRAFAVSLRSCDGQGLLELFRRIESESGRLDLLVNDSVQDASDGSEAFWARPLSAWDDHCGAGLGDCYRAAALAARIMVQQGSGLIINLSGVSNGVPSSTLGGIHTAGLDLMAAGMALELAGQGVSALSLVPDRPPGRARSIGRCIAALAMDPDVAEKSGKRFEVGALRREYRFAELTEESN